MYLENLENQAIQNTNFRIVVATGEHMQLVLMSVDTEIGEETHPDNDQMLYLVQGQGTVVLDGVEESFLVGDVVFVPAGVRHNIINVSNEDQPLKIITTYSPPHHPKGTVHKTKAEADQAEQS